MQRVLQRYKDTDIIAILGMDELSPDDKLNRFACAKNSAVPVAAFFVGDVHRNARKVRAIGDHYRVFEKFWTESTIQSPSNLFT